jgi:hypothetical protein
MLDILDTFIPTRETKTFLALLVKRHESSLLNGETPVEGECDELLKDVRLARAVAEWLHQVPTR